MRKQMERPFEDRDAEAAEAEYQYVQRFEPREQAELPRHRPRGGEEMSLDEKFRLMAELFAEEEEEGESAEGESRYSRRSTQGTRVDEGLSMLQRLAGESEAQERQTIAHRQRIVGPPLGPAWSGGLNERLNSSDQRARRIERNLEKVVDYLMDVGRTVQSLRDDVTKLQERTQEVEHFVMPAGGFGAPSRPSQLMIHVREAFKDFKKQLRKELIGDTGASAGRASDTETPRGVTEERSGGRETTAGASSGPSRS